MFSLMFATLTSYGSGILFSTLLADIMIVVALIVLAQYIAIPLFKQYQFSKKLDLLVGTDLRHWLHGHNQRFSNDEKGIFNLIRNTISFPSVRSVWMGPVFSQVMSYHPDTNISVLGSGAPKSRILYSFLQSWLGEGLLTSKGKKWQRSRRLLTPAFHYKILQPYVKVFNGCARILLERFENDIGNPFEVSKPVSLMTLDTMLQCAMSSKTNCQLNGNHPYIEAVNDFSTIIFRRLFSPWLWKDWIFYLTSEGRKFTKALNLLHSFTEKIIQQRRKAMRNNTDQKEFIDELSSNLKQKKLLDFMDILLQTKDEDGKGLTDIEIRDEVDTFLFEGHDTTASAISWAMYNLARYPELQEKCRKEVIKNTGETKDIEWEDFSNFNYLTMFIKESMRYHSPVPAIGRLLEKSLKLSHSTTPDKVIPAGTTVTVPIFVQHRNPNVWDNPTEFDPERFTKENIAKRSPHAFIPFSAGSRNCIGQIFAMNEIKVVLAQMLRKFKIFLDEETPEPEMVAELVLRSTNGIKVKFSPVQEKKL